MLCKSLDIIGPSHKKNQGYLLNDATVSYICLLQNQYSEKKSFTNEVSNRWNHEEDKQ